MPGATTTLEPREFIRAIKSVQDRLTTEEAGRVWEHARAWVTVFYTGDIPDDIAQDLAEREAAWHS